MIRLAQSNYYEDFEVGDAVRSASRTITETDIVNFAGVSGDFNALHLDAEYAATTSIGHRIAHGALLFAISTGLFNALSITTGRTQVANLGLDGLDYRAPVAIGDTVHLEIVVLDTRETHDGRRGIVRFQVDMLNQDGQTVMRALWKLMLWRRPAAGAEEQDKREEEGGGLS
jgi:acyl dehydratase